MRARPRAASTSRRIRAAGIVRDDVTIVRISAHALSRGLLVHNRRNNRRWRVRVRVCKVNRVAKWTVPVLTATLVRRHLVNDTGCVSRGKCPVSFPANTGFAATFDRITIKAMAGVIGRELRSLYNARRAYGLDCWGPVINLVRSMRAYLAHRSARRLIG